MAHDIPTDGKAPCFFCGNMVNSSIVNGGWSQRYTCDCVGSIGMSGTYQIDLDAKDFIGKDPEKKNDIESLVKQKIADKTGAKICDVSAKSAPNVSGSTVVTVLLLNP